MGRPRMNVSEIQIGKSYWVKDGNSVPHKVIVVRESPNEPRWFMCRNDDIEFVAYPDAFCGQYPLPVEC